MKINYNCNTVEVIIPVDYCQENDMKKWCNKIISLEEPVSWRIEGRNVNHTFDLKEISSAEKRINGLYRQKNKKMHVSEKNSSFGKDEIRLSSKEIKIL